MTFGDFVRGLFRRPIVLVRPEQMPEKEVEKALTEVPETHPVYRAFMQLLYQALEEAHVNAEDDIDLPRKLEAHTGGGKYLREIIANVLGRRSRAAKRRGTSNVQ